MFKKLYHILQRGLGTLPVGSRLPPIAETSALIAENCTKTQPSTGTNFTTIRRTCICFSDQTHSYPPHRRIPLLASLTSQEIPAPQQDQASEESEIVTPQEPLTSTTEQHSISETPIHHVKLVFGMTPVENWQLQDRNQPQDVMDILGTAAFKGYAQTLIQTLDGIYINQLKQFLPLAEEEKCLAEEICKGKQAEQWAGIPHEKLLNQSIIKPGPTKLIANTGTAGTFTIGQGTFTFRHY